MSVTREGEAEESGSSLTGAMRHPPPQKIKIKKGRRKEGRAEQTSRQDLGRGVQRGSTSLDLKLVFLSFGGILGQLLIL